ncbi:MAG: hypothetical protein EAZ42_13395, partial [Verrucomicrobia bacterium]
TLWSALRKQLDTAPATQMTLGYDLANQLISATLTPVANLNSITQRNSYQYDSAGNRVSSQKDNVLTSASHNNANQLTATTSGGKLLVAGSTNEPAKVKINGQNATVTAPPENLYQAWVQVSSGPNILNVEATDYASPTPNVRTKSWSVNITSPPARSFAYDTNGNMTHNGDGQIYTWDAENRLVKITYADSRSTEFTYDGLSRRVRIIEKSATNAITSDKRYLWAGGNQPAEERDANGTTVLKQYHPQGIFTPAAATPLNKLFYTKDHLGSIRELVDANGALQTRYEYDMWGKRTKISGTPESEVGYTGHHHYTGHRNPNHTNSELILTWYRAYDPELGRWLSADPIGEEGGLNLHAYVGNGPLNKTDPLGLEEITEFSKGSADLHTHPEGRQGKNCPAYNIKQTENGFKAEPRGDHKFPKNAQGHLDNNLADPGWVKLTRKAIAEQFDNAKNLATKENLRKLGRGLKKGGKAVGKCAVKKVPYFGWALAAEGAYSGYQEGGFWGGVGGALF